MVATLFKLLWDRLYSTKTPPTVSIPLTKAELMGEGAARLAPASGRQHPFPRDVLIA